MRKTLTVLAAAAATIALAAPAAQASHRHTAEGHGTTLHRATAVVPIGRCKDDPTIMGGSTCQIAIGNYHEGTVQVGFEVWLTNYNDYPVKIRTRYNLGDGPVNIDTRLAAHTEKTFVVEWGTADSAYVQWIDLFNNNNLGSAYPSKP